VPYLIVSDIHGNLEALEAVLADAEGRYDRVLCLGDLVGYGADPNFVVDWVRSHATAVVRGNHDKACSGLDSLEHFRPAAKASAIWTRSVLEPDNVKYLENLPRGPLRYDSFDMVHGSPLDEDDYLVTLSDVAQVRGYLESPVSLFGHTHVQGGFLVSRGGVRRIVPGQLLELEPQHSYLLNPGAVGQPRDHDPRAAYALYSPENRTVEYRRAAYDVAQAAAKIRAAGLPDSLADRLHQGA
jgi:predicted phosphodiesterase